MNRLLALMFASSLVLASATASFADDKDKPASKPAPTKEPAKKDDKPAKPAEKPAEKPADKKDDKKSDKPAMMDPAAMEKMWEEANKPGEYHAWLEKLDGKWTGTAKEMGFDGKMTESECSINNEMRYSRFLTSTYQGKSMGKAYYGRGTLGYNNSTKQFESSWYDNQSVSTTFMTGKADSAGKVLTLNGKCSDPSGKPFNMKCVYTIIGKDAYKIDIYADMTGKEELWQSMSFTREGAKPEAKKEEKPMEKKPEGKPTEKPAPKKAN